MVKAKSSQQKSKRDGYIRLQKLHADSIDFGATTAYGGLALAHQVLHGLGAREKIEGRVEVLQVHRGYGESDHLMHLFSALYSGASCIQDLEHLQTDEAYGKIFNIRSVTHPTTMGDFVRRFSRSDINDYKSALYEMQHAIWEGFSREKRAHATLDIDAKICTVYGNCKKGADFNYKGEFSYHPEMLSLAETGEWLDGINRSGNKSSGAKAAYLLRRNLPRVTEHFEKVCVRGDTQYGRIDVLKMCRSRDTNVALCWKASAGLQKKAEQLPEQSWEILDRSRKQDTAPRKKRCRKKRNMRRTKARKRGYKDKKLKREMVSEFPYVPYSLRGKVEKSYRMVVVRKQVEVAEQTALFDVYEFRFILTDLDDKTPAEIVNFAYGRSNQENLIEQGKNGVSAFRMPTGELLANEVWMITAFFAHNVKTWLSLLALGKKSLGWEWKQFRLHCVHIVAAVSRRSRQLFVSFDRSNPSTPMLLKALRILGAGVA